METGKAKIVNLPKICDPRGNLSVVENMKDVPFEVRRVYWTYDVPSGEERGGHSHKQCREMLIAVSGSFDGESAPFDPEKHKLTVGFSASGAVRKALTEVVVKTRAAAGGLTINSVYDPYLDEINGRITSGSNLIINGVNIKVAGENPSNGVFLTKVGSSEQVKMRLITHNNPSQLTVLLPTLEPGDYQLTITSQFTSGNKLLKDPRSYTFAPLLTVEGEPEPENPDVV